MGCTRGRRSRRTRPVERCWRRASRAGWPAVLGMLGPDRVSMSRSRPFEPWSSRVLGGVSFACQGYSGRGGRMARQRYVGVGAGLSLHVLTWPAVRSTPKPRAGADMQRADSVGSRADADESRADAVGSRVDAAPILLLHGLASSARSWEP